MMEKTLEELSLIELKALAYDQLAVLERSQQNLRVINAEIAKRSQEQKSVVKEVVDMYND
jgi:hypothetical protein